MTDPVLHGGCLCQAITYQVTPPFQHMAHCHCSRCRKATGTGHATNFTAAPGQFRWLTGEHLITRYDLPTARSFGKWFCRQCGSPVPRLTRTGKLMVIPAGSLDDVPSGKPTDHIFWPDRAPWGCPSGGLPTHASYPPNW